MAKKKKTKKPKVDESTKEFYIKQIETTIEIIEEFSKTDKFSPTMLINSLLSLVILPFEKAKRIGSREDGGNKVFPGSYEIIKRDLNFDTVIFQPIKGCRDGNVEYSNKSIYAFVNKFRNGIAHQNLEVQVNEERKLLITIYNKYPNKHCSNCERKECKEKGVKYQKSGVIDFQITVTVQQLQRISLYIANSYLNAIQGENENGTVDS